MTPFYAPGPTFYGGAYGVLGGRSAPFPLYVGLRLPLGNLPFLVLTSSVC